MTMNPQITAILIGVKDLGRAKSFYGEGLGCPIDKDYPQFVSFKLGDGSSEFGLYPREALAADAGVAPEGSGFTGVTFHFIVSSNKEVDEMIGQAQRAGAKVVKPAQA
ncbi:MAG: glyoxalase, partial [Chloroflexi bacterium]